MAKHYPQTLWDAIRAYWENSNASYLDAAKAVSKGEEHPNKSVISSRAKAQGWIKKNADDIHKISDTKTDGLTNKTDGKKKVSDNEKSLAAINILAKKKADINKVKSDGLASLIIENVHLTPSQIDEICVDFRADVVQKHRGDFNKINDVIDYCIEVFRKAMQIIVEGGQALDGDIISKDGIVYDGLARTLLTAEFAIKAMLNAATTKNIIQTNERKSYGLDTYEEPNSTGNLAQKALSSKGMGNHYERIRLSKKDERERMKDKLKSVTH